MNQAISHHFRFFRLSGFSFGTLFLLILFLFQSSSVNASTNTYSTGTPFNLSTPSSSANSFVLSDLYSVGSSNFPDPLESINRPIFSFNLWLDKNLLLPVAKGYKKVIPKAVDKSITNFFTNLENVTSSVNFLIQGEFKKSGQTTVRFFSNAVFGIFGFFDIATEQKIPQYKTSFNQTLKKWNVEEGTYIMLPIFGPNTTRTIVGRVVDFYSDPISYTNRQIFLRILGFVDFRADNQNLFELASSVGFDNYDSMKLFFLKKEQKKSEPISLDGFEPL